MRRNAIKNVALRASHACIAKTKKWGARSSDPSKAQAFSETHYNFAITVEGSFRRALMTAAKQ